VAQPPSNSCLEFRGESPGERAPAPAPGCRGGGTVSVLKLAAGVVSWKKKTSDDVYKTI